MKRNDPVMNSGSQTESSNYEQFRSTILLRLMGMLPEDQLNNVLRVMDAVAADYTISRACTDIIVSKGLPEIVKIYCASLAIENKARGTVDGYLRELRKFFDSVRKPFNAVTTNDIRLYIFHRQQDGQLKKSTTEHIRVIINSFYSWLVNQEYMERNPSRLIEPIRYQRTGREPIPQDELEWLRNACETPREKALIDFLYSTGCRVSECVALTVNDIDWRDRSVKIRHGKGDKYRVTYFNAESEVSLRVYLNSKEHSTPVLFSKKRAPYDRVSRNALEAEVRKIRERVSDLLTVQVVPHALRTTFATNASSSGMPVEHVQQLLGHSNINTTMRYVQTSQNETMNSHRKYIA